MKDHLTKIETDLLTLKWMMTVILAYVAFLVMKEFLWMGS
jgi:hypothetical protein